MPVCSWRGILGAGLCLQHEHADAIANRHAHLAPLHAPADPAPVAKRIRRQRRRPFRMSGGLPGRLRRCFGRDRRERALQRVRRHRHRLAVRKRHPAQTFKRTRRAAAPVACGKMHGDDQSTRFIKRAGGKPRKCRIRRMVEDRHHRSSRASRSFAIARRSRDLTVPNGMPSARAMSACGLSSKKDS